MVPPFIKATYKWWEIWGSAIFFTLNHLLQPYPARYIPSFAGAWGALPFLSFIPLRHYPKRQLHRFFVVHPFIKAAYKYWEIWGSAVLFTSKPRLPTLPRQAHPLLWRGLGRPPIPLSFSPLGLGRPPFIFQIFPSTPPLALKYWKYEHVIFRQDTPFLFFTAAAAASVDQFITFYFLSSLSPNTFLLSFFRCLFFTNFTRSLYFFVTV